MLVVLRTKTFKIGVSDHHQRPRSIHIHSLHEDYVCIGRSNVSSEQKFTIAESKKCITSHQSVYYQAQTTVFIYYQGKHIEICAVSSKL